MTIRRSVLVCVQDRDYDLIHSQKLGWGTAYIYMYAVVGVLSTYCKRSPPLSGITVPKQVGVRQTVWVRIGIIKRWIHGPRRFWGGCDWVAKNLPVSDILIFMPGMGIAVGPKLSLFWECGRVVLKINWLLSYPNVYRNPSMRTNEQTHKCINHCGRSLNFFCRRK